LIANQQIEYCTASINTLVKEGSSACLKAQIAILGDSNLANHSKEVKQAKQLASTLLLRMKTDTDTKATKIDDLIKGIDTVGHSCSPNTHVG